MDTPRSHTRVAALLLALMPVCCLCATARDDDDVRLDELMVTAIRTPRLLRDEPLRVDAVPTEEIEENGTVSPGTLTSLLEEMAGVQFQAAAPGLGGMGLRLRGLPARLTQVRIDGLALLGAAPDAFGLLQAPPLDLGRVEVVKGAASSIYGSGAIGGVLNLVSRAPGAESAAVASLNSLGGQDVTAYLSEEDPGPLTGSLLLGLHRQDKGDRDHDGWAELPGFRRAVLRPRVWWNDGVVRFFGTAGYTREARAGGTVQGSSLPPFRLNLDTDRRDLGATAQGPLDGALAWHVAVSWARASMDQRAETYRSRYGLDQGSAEAWLSGNVKGHDWLVGVGWQARSFGVEGRPELGSRDAGTSLFVQDEWAAVEGLRVSASLRRDAFARQGNPVSGRLALLWQPAPSSVWSLRASAARGFALPTVLLEEVESVGPGVLSARPALRIERGDTSAVDLHWTSGDLELDLGVFESRLQDRLGVVGSGSDAQVMNLPGQARIPGTEVVARYVEGALHIIGNWTWLRPRESDLTGVGRDIERVPRQTAELAILLEADRRGRVGIEFGYTGRQPVQGDPARDHAPGYLQVGLLAAWRVRQASLFLNVENLTDVRQSQFGGLVSASPGLGGLPAREAWAPLEGRRFNLGVSLEL